MEAVLSGTPLWVWLVLLGVVYLGWKQSRDRFVSRQRAFLLPCVMMVWSLYSALTHFPTMDVFVFWPIGACVAFVGGTWFFPLNEAYFDAHADQFYIKGSWVPLMLILGIFITKYVIGAFGSEIMGRVGVIPLLITLFGFFSGAFASRAWRLWWTERTPSLQEK